MSKIYNPLKLPEYRYLFKGKKILVIGAGAVGSALMEYFAKMGVSVDALDYDHYTLENAAKGSCLIRTPEDAGRNKAQCAAERVKPLLDDGCTANGIDADLCKLGPEAFADYDVVVAAVDNYAAKVLFSELFMQLDEGRRPVILMTGTREETAQSVICDGKEFCLRCLIDEGWMKDSSIRTSCSGPQYRKFEGIPEIIRTSNLASSLAAHLSAEQVRAFFTGCGDVINRRVTYTAYPNLEISVSRPMRKRGCPGCTMRPPRKINRLSGNIMETTLENAFSRISEVLGTEDYEMVAHQLHYKKVTYSEFILTGSCQCCRKEISVMKHEGRAFPDDFICEDCRKEGNLFKTSGNNGFGHSVNVFTPRSTGDDLKKMALYDLGYPLGAHIEIIQRNGALDFLDQDNISRSFFAFSQDPFLMHSINQLK